MCDIMCTVCSLSLADTTRLQTLIQIVASEVSSDLADSGHRYAMMHAASTLQSCSASRELMSGLAQVSKSHVDCIRQFLARDSFVRTNDHAIAMMSVRLSVHLSGTGMNCDHTVHCSAH